jgi:uncharacterized protein YlzI (FlbEa/FlbD family)
MQPETILVRYIFKEDEAQLFSDHGGNVKEMLFTDVADAIEQTEAFRDSLEDVIMLMNGQMYCLTEITEQEAKKVKRRRGK